MIFENRTCKDYKIEKNARKNDLNNINVNFKSHPNGKTFQNKFLERFFIF